MIVCEKSNKITYKRVGGYGMKEVKVCIGSACHIKGAYHVIEAIQRLIEEHQLSDEIELKAAFCLGHCTQAVSTMRWDGEIISINKEQVEDIFKTEFMAHL